MNNVSIFIYIADLVGRLGPALALVSCLSLFLSFMAIMIGVDGNSKTPTSPNVLKFLRRSFITGVVCGLVAIFLPSQKAMYMIAGSQVGETVVKSEEGKKIIDSLSSRIRGEIENYDKQK